MGYCWRCFSEVEKNASTCQSCGFKLKFSIGNSKPSIVLPENGNVESSFKSKIRRTLFNKEEVDSSFNSLVRKSSEPYFELKDILTTYKNNFEKASRTKVDIQVWPFKDLDYFVKNVIEDKKMKDDIYIGFLNLAFQIRFLEMEIDEEIVKYLGKASSSKSSPSHMTEFIKMYKQLKRNGVFDEHLKDSTQGSFRPYADSIEIRKIPNNMIEEAIDPGTLELSKPFLRSMETKKQDKFRAHISHELTHAYIRRKLDHGWSKPVLKGIEEAACNVVTYIKWDKFFEFNDDGKFISFVINSYRDKRIPKSTLKVSVRAFLDLLDDYDGDNEVDYIRQEAVDAIKRIQRNEGMSPAKAILQNEKLEREHKIYRDLEVAEYLSIHSFFMLGIIDSNKEEMFNSWVYDAVEGSTPYNFDKNLPELEDKRVDPLLKKDLDLMKDSKLELRKFRKEVGGNRSLKKLSQNLSKLTDLMEEEVKFLENPFCPSCGMVLSPEDEFCTNCGEKVKTGAADFDKGLEFLLRETARSSHSFSSGEKQRRFTLEEVLINFEMLIAYGQRMNATILRTLEKLHSSEQDSAKVLQQINESSEMKQKYPNLARLINTTEETYHVSKRCSQLLSRANDAIERAKEQFEKTNQPE